MVRVERFRREREGRKSSFRVGFYPFVSTVQDAPQPSCPRRTGWRSTEEIIKIHQDPLKYS